MNVEPLARALGVGAPFRLNPRIPDVSPPRRVNASGQLSICSSRVRLLTDYAEEQGLNAVDILRACDIDCRILGDLDTRVPADNFLKLRALIADYVGAAHLGLELGARMQHRYLGTYGFTLLSCCTTRELLREFLRYSVLSNNSGRVSVENRGDHCVMSWRSFLTPGTDGAIFLDELVLASWTTMRQQFGCSNGAPPKWVSFRHAAPRDPGPYENLFRCEVRFDANEVALAFNSSDLDEQLPHGNPQVLAVMTSLCHRLRRQLGDPQDPAWLTECRRVVIDAFRNGDPDIANVSGVLGMSPDMLRQKFKQHGLSFRTFTDELRHDLALSYLDDSTLHLADVTHQLGFSEQSAFQRAFKRWTGKTPGEYRRNAVMEENRMLR
jgi:AraC-like DNA-binding protein